MLEAKKITKNELGVSSRNEVKAIYKPLTKNFDEAITPIPDDIFETIFSYLMLVSSCFSDLRGNEAKCMYFICPIIVAVCNTFKGEEK